MGRKSVLLALCFFAATFSLNAQMNQFLESSVPRLISNDDVMKPLFQSSEIPLEELVPLDGEVDRNIYRLGPGDKVNVSIWGTEPVFSHELTVSAEGRLLISPAGAFKVSGMTLAEAEEYLGIKLADFYSNKTSLTLSLMNPRRFRAYVSGSVSHPGTYAVTAMDRVSDLLRAAGGIKRGGSRRRVKLMTRTSELVEEVDVFHHLTTGELKYNPRLIDGCVVDVPSMEKYIILTGSFPNLVGFDTVRVQSWNLELANEFTVEFLEGETLENILQLVGRPQMEDTALVGNVLISQVDSSGQDFVPIDSKMLYEPLENGMHFQFPGRSNWVFVTGATNSSGRYIFQPGWTVQDYLGQAGGPNFNGSRKTIYLKRRDGREFKCASTEAVYPGDVIFVPEKFRIDRLYPTFAGVLTATIYVLFK